MTEKQKTARTSKKETCYHYLPVAVAQLQVEVAQDLFYAADRHVLENKPAFAAVDRIRLAAKAHLADMYNDFVEPRSHNYYREVKPFSELTSGDLDTLREEADKIRRWRRQRDSKIFAPNKFNVANFRGIDGKLGEAIKASAETIKWADDSRLDLRFVTDSGLREREGYGHVRRHSNVSDEDFDAVLRAIYRIQYAAWCTLLMFTGMVGGSVFKSAIVAAADDFTGHSEDEDRGIKTAIMQYLNVCHRLPGRYLVDDENQFRAEIADAIKRMK